MYGTNEEHKNKITQQMEYFLNGKNKKYFLSIFYNKHFNDVKTYLFKLQWLDVSWKLQKKYRFCVFVRNNGRYSFAYILNLTRFFPPSDRDSFCEDNWTNLEFL